MTACRLHPNRFLCCAPTSGQSCPKSPPDQGKGPPVDRLALGFQCPNLENTRICIVSRNDGTPVNGRQPSTPSVKHDAPAAGRSTQVAIMVAKIS
jgi:hypothetical protein